MRPVHAAAVCLAATLMAFAALPARAADGDQPRVLTVTGEGEARGAPDTAALSAGVVTNARTAAQALAANARAMNAVFATLKGAGIAEKDMQTSGFSVQPQYTDATTNVPARLTGYQVTNNVSVRVDDLDHLGATLDALVASGANSIGDIAFTQRDPKPMMADARAAAVADAMARAQALAKAAGVTLGPIVSITDGGGDTVEPAGAVRAMTIAGNTTPIARGEKTVSASVTIVWDIR